MRIRPNVFFFLRTLIVASRRTDTWVITGAQNKHQFPFHKRELTRPVVLCGSRLIRISIVFGLHLGGLGFQNLVSPYVDGSYSTGAVSLPMRAMVHAVMSWQSGRYMRCAPNYSRRDATHTQQRHLGFDRTNSAWRKIKIHRLQAGKEMID